MSQQGVFRRRHLPHIDVEGKPFFVTGCLAGSLSASGLSRIRRYGEEMDARPKPESLTPNEWELKKHKLVFRLVDQLLDGESPVHHLDDDRLAQIVRDAFLHFAGERYSLLAFVVMPSHHHWLFLPDPRWSEKFTAAQVGKRHKRTPREAISHSIQSFTGSMCNRILGKTGAFWQTETYDHFARDEAEVFRIVDYIEQNPVKAGLVDDAAKCRWSSACIRRKLGIPHGQPIPKLVG